MRKTKIVLACIAGALTLCVAGYHLLLLLIFHPVNMHDVDFLHECGMFQDVEIVKCAYTQDLFPKMKRLISLMFPLDLSYFGKAELSEESLDTLLGAYTWEEFTVTEAVWEDKYSNPFTLPSEMREFKALKKQYVGKTFWVCHDFNRERMSRGGGGCGYLLPQSHTMYFFYTAM